MRAPAATNDAALASAVAARTAIAEIDAEPLYEAARLLYEGPWLAERYLAARSILERDPDALHPVTRGIIAARAKPLATDAFAAFYRLEELRRATDALFERAGALVLPTALTVYTREQVLSDPVRLNSRLGTYTNFVNLLDLCGVAVPAALHDDRMPFGVTVVAPGGSDSLAASIAKRFQSDTGLPAGAHRPRPAGAAARAS